jgi:hypothetical protein
MILESEDAWQNFGERVGMMNLTPIASPISLRNSQVKKLTLSCHEKTLTDFTT